MSQLEKDIVNFNEMLGSLREGEGKYIPTLKIQKDKLSTKCSQIADIIYELNSQSINEDDGVVAAVLKDKGKKWETKLCDNLELVGTAQESFEEAMAEHENNLRVKKETDYHKAMRLELASRMVGGGIGRTKDMATSIKKTCNIR